MDLEAQPMTELEAREVPRRTKKTLIRIAASMLVVSSFAFFAQSEVPNKTLAKAKEIIEIEPDKNTHKVQDLVNKQQPIGEIVLKLIDKSIQSPDFAAWISVADPNADGKYDRLAQCETAGNWQMQGSRYSGGVGFYNGTWDAYRLPGMPANAGQATKAQQIEVAERVRWELPPHGSFRGKWGCAPSVGLP